MNPHYEEHFYIDIATGAINGRTAVGRATVAPAADADPVSFGVSSHLYVFPDRILQRRRVTRTRRDRRPGIFTTRRPASDRFARHFPVLPPYPRSRRPFPSPFDVPNERAPASAHP